MARKSLSSICKLIQDVKEEQPIEKQFITDLKRSIEMDEEKNKRKPSNYYKPSSMNCIRSMYYTRLGVDQDENGTSYVLAGICNCGTDIHERVQKYVSSMIDNNIDCEYVDVAQYVKDNNLDGIEIIGQSGMETKLKNTKLNLSFLCDGIIKYKGRYYILELKTESSRKFYNREDVDSSHYNQATAYSLSMNLSGVIFVYINRDIFDFKCYLFRPTDEMKQNLVDKVTTCEEHVLRKNVPEKPDTLPRKVCEYCNYKEQCRKDG